jgi:hypothetical protein
MLTKQGRLNRFWERYPHLRKILQSEEEPIPHGVDLLALVDDDTPRMSIDAGRLGRLADAIAIARLLAARAEEVTQAMRLNPPGADGITNDVSELLSTLEADFSDLQHTLARAANREIRAIVPVANEIHKLRARLKFEE